MSLRRLVIALFCVSLLGSVACSSQKGAKKDDPTLGETRVQEVPPADDFLGGDVEVEEMPSADSLGSPSSDSAESSEVSSSAASDIARAVRAAEKGDKDGAASDLARLADSSDGGFLAAFNLGVIRERQGMYDRAAKRYFQSLQKNPDFTPALENLVRLYLRQDQTSDAERIARKFIDSRPQNLSHRAILLNIGLHRGSYEDVIQSATQLLRQDERHVGAMYAMAEANFQLGRYELAKSIIESAVELQPERAELFYTAGLIELELENEAGAMANFRKATELRPQYPEAHNNLGVLYQRARDYEAAEEEFKEAIRHYPDFKQAYLNLGNAYKGATKYKDAELAFKKAISLDPQFADAHFNLGILYLDGEVPGMDAISRLQKAVDSLNAYKRVAKGKIAADDPVDKYVEEAKNAIEIERQKQEMMREQQMGAEQ